MIEIEPSNKSEKLPKIHIHCPYPYGKTFSKKVYLLRILTYPHFPSTQVKTSTKKLKL